MEEEKRSYFRISVIFVLIVFIFYNGWSIYRASLTIYKAQQNLIKLEQTYIQVLLSTNQTDTQNELLKETLVGNLSTIEKWIDVNNETFFRLSKKDISTEFMLLKKCWLSQLVSVDSSRVKRCTIVFLNIKKSILSYISKYKKRLMIYISLLILLVVISMILLGRVVKGHIKRVIEENIIFDTESKLYSYYYCIDIIKKLSYQSDRTKRPISAIFIQLPQLEKYVLEDRKRILESIGEYITSTVRLSDIACRYGTSSFLILMPNTPIKDNIPVNRIHNELTQYIRNFSPTFEIIVSSCTREFEEDYRDFLKRATNF